MNFWGSDKSPFGYESGINGGGTAMVLTIAGFQH